MPAEQRRIFGVRKLLVLTVSLVRGRDDNLLYRGTAATRFEQPPGARDVAFERRNWIAVGDTDNRLRREMNDGVDLILTKRTFHRLLIAPVAAHDFHPLQQRALDQFALRHPVAQEANYVSVRSQQSPHKPTTKQSTRARDEHRPILPEIRVV